MRKTQNQNESILKRTVMLYQNIIFWLNHNFTISICVTVSEFNDHLKNQFDKEKGYEGIKKYKSFSLKIKEAIKKCCSHRERRKTIGQTLQPGHLPTKITRYWLYIWTSYSVWCSSNWKHFCGWLRVNHKNEYK